MIYVLLGLYFLSGFIIWRIGVTDAGGRKKYIMIIAEDHEYPVLLYYLAFIAVVIFWPFFIVGGLIRRNED